MANNSVWITAEELQGQTGPVCVPYVSQDTHQPRRLASLLCVLAGGFPTDCGQQLEDDGWGTTVGQQTGSAESISQGG